MLANAFAPCTEKYVKAKVSYMSCSPKLDLLAMACLTGELVLYRLVTQDKLPVWTLPVPESGVDILSLCWRPDGKVVAVGYSCCKHGVRFVYMEKAELLWGFSSSDKTLTEPATLLKWVPVDEGILGPNRGQESGSLSSEAYLPKLKTLESDSQEFTGRYMDNLGDNAPHILLLCSPSCSVTVMANGIFPILKICCEPNISKLSYKMSIVDLLISDKLDFLCVVLEKHNDDVTTCSVRIHDIKVLSENMRLYDTIAQKVLKISSIKSHLGTIFDCMNETCDTVMQEVESQLTNFLVKKNPNGVIGDDFMQLLIWGKPTESLKHILTHHFTKKQIKKLGQLVESSYTNIQQLLVVNFQIALDSLFYLFTEIRGIVAKPGSILSFLEPDVENLVTITGSLMLKTTELLQVIGTSLKNYKAFFRWLYVSMLKMQDEPLDKLGSMSENEIAFIADFIYEHFSVRQKSGIKKEKQFNLEKVYQYLKNEPLSLPMKNNTNEWCSFLNASSLMTHSKFMLQQRPDSSLRQLFNELNENLQILTSFPKSPLNEMCSLSYDIQLFEAAENFSPKSKIWLKNMKPSDPDQSQNVDSQNICILVADSKPPSPNVIYMCLDPKDLETSTELEAKALKIQFSLFNENLESDGSQDHLEIVDFDSYDENMVTMLLCDKTIAGKRRQNWLAQVSLSTASRQLQEIGISLEKSGKSEKFWTFSAKNLPLIDANPMCVEVRTLRSDINAFSVISSFERKAACILTSDMQLIFPFILDSSEDEDLYDDDLDEHIG